MDILEYNRQAWNRESLNDGEWSVPVSEEIISAARNGAWQVVLTPLKPVPKSWFGNLHGKKVLCLASGGGQQAPVLAAAGAIVVQGIRTDNSTLTLIHDLHAPSPWCWLLRYGYRLTVLIVRFLSYLKPHPRANAAAYGRWRKKLARPLHCVHPR